MVKALNFHFGGGAGNVFDLWSGNQGASQMVLVVNNLPGNAGDVGSILGSGRSPGVLNGNPL